MALLRRLIVLGVVISGVPAVAIDRPIDAVKLVLGGAGAEKLVFVSRDRDVPFPTGDDDPVTAGAALELFSPVEPTGVMLAIPAGTGKPGWVAKRGLYRFVDSRAPVTLAVLKRGRVLKLTARVRGLALADAQGAVGIRFTVGSVRTCALFDAPTVVQDRPGRFVAKGARAARLSDCSDASLGGTAATTTTLAGGATSTTTPTTSPTPSSTTTTTSPTSCDTFQNIQSAIFNAHGCNASVCHGGQFLQANLDLQPGAAYRSLVNVPANNSVAAAAGKKRVVPGDAFASFLSQKLHGTLLAGEGVQMPFAGDPLSALELALVDAWINGGAPETGSVPGAPCLPVASTAGTTVGDGPTGLIPPAAEDAMCILTRQYYQ